MSENSDTNLLRRLHDALHADATTLSAIMADHDTEVIAAALRNPALESSHLLQLLQRPELPGTIIQAICSHHLSGEYRLRCAIVRHPAVTPALAHQMLETLPLFELLNLCTLPGYSADIRLAAQRQIVCRLPTEPLGNKLTLTRRATATLLPHLLAEGDKRIIDIALNNPRLKEAALHQFLRSAAATAETISAIARHPRWNQRPNLRLAILNNPRTPRVWFTQFVPKLPRMQQRNLRHSGKLTAMQKKWLEEILSR